MAQAIVERDARALELWLTPIQTWSPGAIWPSVDSLLQTVTEQGWREGSDCILRSLPEPLRALGAQKRHVWALNADQDHLLDDGVPMGVPVFMTAMNYNAKRAQLRLVNAGALDLSEDASEQEVTVVKQHLRDAVFSMAIDAPTPTDPTALAALTRFTTHPLVEPEDLYTILAWAICSHEDELYRLVGTRLDGHRMDPDQSINASYAFACCVSSQRLDLLADLVERHGLKADAALVLLYHAVDDENDEAVRWLVQHHERILPMSTHKAAQLLNRAMDPRHGEVFQRQVLSALAHLDADEMFTRTWEVMDEDQVWAGDPKRAALILLAPKALQTVWLDEHPELYAGVRARLREIATLDTVARPAASKPRPRT